MTRGGDLRATARDGRRLRAALLDTRVALTTRELCRIGFVVPKYGHSAVDRNRLKRSLRELARIRILGVLRADVAPTGMDIVMRALPHAYRASFDDLRAEVDSLGTRLLRLTERSGRGGQSESTGLDEA